LHRNLDNIMATTEKMFRELTVAAVLAQPGSVSPLCAAQALHNIGLG